MCYLSTGVKLIVVAESKQQRVEEILKRIYELYADYVLKNPFYSLDMPIRYNCTFRQCCNYSKLCIMLILPLTGVNISAQI